MAPCAWSVLVAIVVAALAAPAAAGAPPVDPWGAARAAMLAEIASDVRKTAEWTARRELDPRVMAALGRLPREEFVPPSERASAYENRPLPIGFGQTISQPYIVALMSDLLATEAGDTVLEVGTGSGYQAAVLGELVERVYTIEIVPELGEGARERLRRLGCSNVEVRIGDGYDGWPERGPFDAILVAAAASHIPPPLVQQLAAGGRMVIPVGGPFTVQQLMLVVKTPEGKITTRQILPVAFVPLVRR